jgi:hypothetical protein
MNHFDSSWEGSSNPEILSGVARVRVQGRDFRFPLPNFRAFSDLAQALNLAHDVGRVQGIEFLAGRMQAALDEV